MILIDTSQLILSEAAVEYMHTPEKYNKSSLQKSVIKKIINVLKQYNRTFGGIVLCEDCPFKSWRHGVFEHYKFTRKAHKETMDFDWDKYFTYYNDILESFRANLPVKIVMCQGAEGDDVIATLTKHFHTRENILIWSSDRDFLQLQKYNNVQQYSYKKKEMLRVDDPVMSLNEKIVQGDKGDGIPNCLSNDKVFVNGERQKRITDKVKFVLLENGKPPEQNAPNREILENLERNRKLIDFDCIPIELDKSIIECYNTYIPPKKSSFQKYLLSNGLMDMINMIKLF